MFVDAHYFVGFLFIADLTCEEQINMPESSESNKGTAPAYDARDCLFRVGLL